MKYWLASIAILGFVSCSSDEGVPPLQGTVRGDDPLAAQIFATAQAEEAAGEREKAIKSYGWLLKKCPVDKRAAESKFRQATLLKEEGRAVDSFKTFQGFIERYPGSSLYQSAITQQEEIAHAAAHGTIRTNFLGLKSRLDRNIIVGMLEKVRDNAPRANSAPRAQFTLSLIHI